MYMLDKLNSCHCFPHNWIELRHSFYHGVSTFHKTNISFSEDEPIMLHVRQHKQKWNARSWTSVCVRTWSERFRISGERGTSGPDHSLCARAVTVTPSDWRCTILDATICASEGQNAFVYQAVSRTRYTV